MDKSRAELIFTTGPQAGQREKLIGDMIVFGRSPECDIQLTEGYVSRRQFELVLGGEGWVFESLSSSPCQINGIKTKSRKRVILDTGDVISVAVDTEMLFVAAGDDPDKALAAYRRGEIETRLPPVIDASSETDILLAQPDEEDRSQSASGSASVAEDAKLSVTQEDIELKKAKIRKYLTIFCIYVAVVILVGIGLSLFTPSRQNRRNAHIPKVLRRDDVRRAIGEEFEVGGNVLKMDASLARASRLWLERDSSLGNLALAVEAYKEAKSQSRQGSLMSADKGIYREGKQLLTDRIWKRYDESQTLIRKGKLQQAARSLRELLDMLPLDATCVGGIRKNVIEYESYVRRLLKSRRR